MLIDHKKYELFGKTLIQKVVLTPPFLLPFPISDNACFLYLIKGNIFYKNEDIKKVIPNNHSLFLNCLNSVKEIGNTDLENAIELVVINFHPSVLQRIYDNELTAILKPTKITISNKSTEFISNDYLIEKYIEGFLFYFENPSLVNENILVVKLKEIILLLFQTKNAESIQLGYYHQSDPGIIIQSDPPKLSTRLIA